eukprot:351937-Chlamydomonas_euryale.AAC.2
MFALPRGSGTSASLWLCFALAMTASRPGCRGTRGLCFLTLAVDCWPVDRVDATVTFVGSHAPSAGACHISWQLQCAYTACGAGIA